MGRKPPKDRQAAFRFYAELNDFLPPETDGPERPYRFSGKPSVKDAIEAQGVPHAEVELILVNGREADFGRPLRHGDRVAVYPVFESFDVASAVRLREGPLREIAFVLDGHLGKLARWLRLLGFDAAYRNDFEDAEVADLSARQGRVVLTRDRRLLHRKAIERGYWVRSLRPDEQIAEVLRRFQLERAVRPFRRCLACNGLLRPVPKAEILDQLEPKTRRYYDDFRRCQSCGKIYWKGSHYDRMAAKLSRALGPEAKSVERP